jgi:hypothetical protein
MHTPSLKAVAIAIGAALAGVSGAQPFGHREPNGVDWLTGGVTIEERDAMRGVAPDYNLRVVVAVQRTGEYRSDVPISVEDGNGNPVLAVVTDGPWLFARVAPGRYRVRTGDGQEQTVEIGANGRAVVYFRSAGE